MHAETKRRFPQKTKALVFWTALAVCVAGANGCGHPQEPGEARQPAASPDTESDSSPQQRTPPEPQAARAELGRQLYARHCAACHGERGDGQGVAAAYLFPKPRDFRAGRFRLVSTANNVPTKADLQAVLERGMPGSSMPPWGHLSQADRDALVDEVMRLRREGARAQYIALLKEEDELTDEEIAAADVQEEIEEYVERFSTPGATTEVPEFPPSDAQSVARGKEVYANFGCIQCHGQEGKGDGVQEMFDDEKLPTAPRDFTAGIFKGGHDTASLYRRTAYGMPGTPMPSSQHMSPAQMVDLVHYIRSMSTEGQREAAVLNRQRLAVRRVARLPSGPTDSSWEDVPAAMLRMTPLWWRDNADPDLRVQAVHDGQTIAVRLSWHDTIDDVNALRTESFTDAVAMELYRGDSEPFLGMGAADATIDIWLWAADQQAKPMTVEESYPRSVVDVYPFSESVVASAELDRGGARTVDQPDISLPARATGNQIVPTRDGPGASSLAVGGPGSLTFRLPKSQLVTAHGEWKDGQWTVMMTRSLAVTSDEDGVPLEPGGRASAAFAVWDGSHRERDGMKSITIWQDLELEE
jgi:DMSO reductase family type II enzyme heme b subunit